MNPEEIETAQRIGMELQDIVNLVIFGGIAAYVLYSVYRTVAMVAKLRQVAARLGIVPHQEGLGSISIWGTLDDGRTVNVYSTSDGSRVASVLTLLRFLIIPWTGRRNYQVTVGIHGAATPDVPAGERAMFDEYVHRSLPAAMDRQRYLLTPARMDDARYDRNSLCCSHLSLTAPAGTLADAILGLAEVAREVEQKALEAIGRYADSALHSVTIRTRAPATGDDGIATESVACPSCGARTPTSLPRCQMCGKPIEASVGA